MREIVGGLLQYKDGNTWKDIPALVGKTGDKGDIGNTPNLSIGTVTALDTGETPTATLTGTTDAPVLNLGLPRGLTGEVTEQELDDALKLKGDCFTDTASGSIASFSDGANDTPIKSMLIDIVPTETGTGTKSAENPWTIGGRTGATLRQCGINFFDVRDAYRYDSENPDTLVISGDSYYRDFYTNKTGGSQTYNLNLLDKALYLHNGQYYFYFETGLSVSVKRVNPTTGDLTGNPTISNGDLLQITAGSGFFTIQRRTNSTQTYKNFMITKAQNAPYQRGGTTKTAITFGSTIYGGQISIAQDGTVKLKVYPYYSSYNGEELTGKWVSSMDEYSAGATPTTGAFVVDLSGQYTEEITLTPITPIKTLLGVNNLWADCGDVSVQYRADTKLYIDRKVASLV